ncbi:hypothetical protein C4577_02450 [Candidatus Parcubacteria bacterium]|nr:MAG: hypothetical protein C4577_02450 [Candidatus Parcubacteria bacterium]
MTYPKDIYIPGIIGEHQNTGELFSSQREVSHILESNFGKLISVEQISGGLVHYVYRVTGAKRGAIIKIRGNNYSALPDISMSSTDIQYENRALQLMSIIEPSTFPQVLGFYSERSMIIMTDVMPNRCTLENDLNDKRATSQDMKELGETVARIHRKLEPLEVSTRDGKDDEVYNTDLFYRLGFRDNLVLNETVEQLKQLPRQLILADLSPKNIGRGENGSITICDLDSFFRGSTLYALAFLAGHILIHSLDDFDRGVQLLNGLLDGYRIELPNADVDSLLFKRVALGVALYRLNNPVIPYNLPLSEVEKLQKADTVLNLLNAQNLTWIKIIQELTASNK